MSKKKINIISEIVQHNLCVGCGACTTICPQKIIYINISEYGEYQAGITDLQKCGSKCSLCLSVCPFSDFSLNETEIGYSFFSQKSNINHNPFTGYYLSALVGSIKDQNRRIGSASGGLATWVQEKLLLTGVVDAVINVQPNPISLFTYKLCSAVNEIRVGARSCYYPVEMTEILNKITHSNKRYAIIALPCFCKAIRNLQLKKPNLNKKILFLLGLTCGHTVSTGLVESTCARLGGNPEQITSVMFRKKDPERNTSDYGIEIKSISLTGDEHCITTYWTDGYGKFWTKRLFALHSCNFCDDIYAECADATFMDAWLPPYKEDWRGHTILLSRSEEIDNIITQNKEEISQTSISIEEVIQSQYSNIVFKRFKFQQRIRYLKNLGFRIPKKRDNRVKAKYEIGDKQEIATLLEISFASRQLWRKCNKNYHQFKSEFATLFGEIDKIEKRKKIYRYPNAILRKIPL